MNHTELDKVLADYLVGKRVSADALRRALDLVNEDEIAARALAEEIRGGEADDCDIFRHNLAALSEMSLPRLQRESPQMLAHLGACAECRAAYWEIGSSWRPAQAREITATISKELTVGISLKLHRAGRFIASKLDLRASYQLAIQGILLGAPPPDETEQTIETQHIEWDLRDDEAQCLIHLTMDSLSSGQAALKCELRPDPGSDVEVSGARLELRKAETGALQRSGLLAPFQRQPITLPPGDWIVRMLATGGGQSFVWQIPITLDP